MLGKVQSKCGVRRRTELYQWESTMNNNKNPKEGRPTGLRGEGQGRLNINS